MLSAGSQDAVRAKLHAASPRGLETGGYLFARQRLPFFADVVHASGPAPTSQHTRTSVILGTPNQVRAEFGEFLARADLESSATFTRTHGETGSRRVRTSAPGGGGLPTFAAGTDGSA